MKLGRRSKLAAKVVVSLGLLGWLVAEVGTQEIVRALSAADLTLVGAAFLLILADGVLRGWNWRLVLGARGASPPFREVLYSFYIGGFFGSFIPSSLGPDAARTVALSRRSDLGVAPAASSVVMLNLVGLWALGFVLVCGVVALLAERALPGAFVWLAAACAGGVALLPALLATRAPLPDVRPSSKLGKRVAEFARTLADYREAGWSLWPVFAIALVNQAAAVLVIFTVFRSGGIDVPVSYFLAIVPVVHVSRLVPVSIAGFGAEQGVVVGLFHLADVDAAAALAMSVLVSGLNLVEQMLVGFLYLGMSARSLGRSLRGAEAPGSWENEAGGGEARDEPAEVAEHARGTEA